MQENLSIVLLEIQLTWESPEANRKSIAQKLEHLSADVDLVVLPEMFTTGFSMQPEKFAEAMDGETVSWMQAQASKHKIAIAGSIAIREKDSFKNRFLFVHESGAIDFYDKRHLFGMGGEVAAYTAGNTSGIIPFKGWRLCLRICYDLRFPAWCRNQSDYDLILFTANWPNPRIQAWDTLLQARAIENMAYCIGVNRTGTDPHGNYYPGHSAAYHPLGERISASSGDWQEVQVSASTLKKLRDQLPFLQDRDSFEME